MRKVWCEVPYRVIANIDSLVAYDVESGDTAFIVVRVMTDTVMMKDKEEKELGRRRRKRGRLRG